MEKATTQKETSPSKTEAEETARADWYRSSACNPREEVPKMTNHKSRLQKLEDKHASKCPPVFHVEIVEITEAHRQAQREAHARGERYYIIEPPEVQTHDKP